MEKKMNNAMEWKESLSVGIDAIDDQHKSLIERLNQVSAALASNQGEKEVARTLDFLIKYTNYHFSKEEGYMSQYNYPGLTEQRETHEALVRMLVGFEEEFIEDGANKNLANAIDVFLVNWLTKHIEGLDVKFGDFLKENNISIDAQDE